MFSEVVDIHRGTFVASLHIDLIRNLLESLVHSPLIDFLSYHGFQHLGRICTRSGYASLRTLISMFDTNNTLNSKHSQRARLRRLWRKWWRQPILLWQWQQQQPLQRRRQLLRIILQPREQDHNRTCRTRRARLRRILPSRRYPHPTGFLPRSLACPRSTADIWISDLHRDIRHWHLHGYALGPVEPSTPDYWNRAFRAAVLPANFGLPSSYNVQEA